MKRLLRYGVVLTVATLTALCFKVFYLNPLFFGAPYKTYPADTIIAKPEEITPTVTDMIKSMSTLDVLRSLLVGIIICFVLWAVEMIVKRLKSTIEK